MLSARTTTKKIFTKYFCWLFFRICYQQFPQNNHTTYAGYMYTHSEMEWYCYLCILEYLSVKWFHIFSSEGYPTREMYIKELYILPLSFLKYMYMYMVVITPEFLRNVYWIAFPLYYTEYIRKVIILCIIFGFCITLLSKKH